MRTKLTRIHGILKEMNEMLALSFENLQAFRVIHETWPVGETRILSGCPSTKVFQNDSVIRLETEMPTNSGFGVHWHDCYERCIVLEGILCDDEIDASRFWRTGEDYIVKKMTQHKPYNPSDTEITKLIVEFIKKD
jgi:hypothetical protein